MDMGIKKNDIINVDITDKGSMTKNIAYYDGKKILVSGAYVGQNVDIKITKIKSKRIEAVVHKVLKKADYECVPNCEDFGRCGGCSMQNITYEAQLQTKEDYVFDLFNKAEINYAQREAIIPSKHIFAYRNKMEFSFGDEVKDGPLTLGMHEKGRHHSVVSLKNCEISPDDFNTIKIAVEDYFIRNNTPFYNKNTKQGYLRHLVLRHSVYENKTLVNLVTTTSEKLNVEEFVNLLTSLKLEGSIAGILLTSNNSFSDIVKPEEMKLLYGMDFLIEKVCGLKFKISPFSFFQTNSLGAEKLYNKAIEYAGDLSDKTVFDLYCGTGTIAQIAARKAKKVYGIELVAEAIEAAKINAQLNELTNCEFVCGDVLTEVENLKDKPDVIILDPPRAGIHPKAIDKIISFNPEIFVYVSCKASSLITDLPSFIEAGYKVIKVCPVDMFSHTEHVETVVLMSREK